ncbi:MAG TPA: protein kinase [Pyrinomonadaceae bacterium]|nr:protein kinase [Pyrinomonadaceae bacterium]
MVACPECASEVADNDIYCPYCGISLHPADLVAAPDDPLAQTIVTSISELPIPAAVEPARVDEEVRTPVPPPIEDSEPVAAILPERDPTVSEIPETTEATAEAELPAVAVIAENPPEVEVSSESNAPDTDTEFESTLHDFPLVEGSGAERSVEPVHQNLAPEETSIPANEIASENPAATSAPDTQVETPPREEARVEPPLIAEPPIPEVLARAAEESVSSAQEEVSGRQVDAATVESGTANAAPEELKRDHDTSAISDSADKGSKPRLQILTGGTVLNNRYEIVKKIGGGGMGAVYLSNDRNLGGVQRAVKEMVQAHIEDAQQAKAIDDFRRESMILSSLDHPSIPTIYDYFFDSTEGRFYLVMKYISGGDLAGRLRAAPEGRIDELTVAEWGFQIADVLSYLHNLPQRIVYRDLKPSNVMLDGSTGKIMLIDFGIARSVNQIEERGVTAVGTMGYAPPELFSGNVEPRSDIYSLGSTMFHLMTGADPQNNPLLIFDFEKNPRPRQINPRLSDQIEKILMKCVEYSAEKRFASAADLRDALGEHADSLRAGRLTFGVGAAPVAVGLDDQTVFCGFCGQRIVAADMFCAFCGARQPLAQNAPPSASVQFSNPFRSARTARLVVEGTTDLEAPVYLIEKPENLLGRRDPMSNIFPEVDLSKFDPQTKISRRHARIIHDGADFLVEDLGSSNGTTVLSTESGNLRLRPNQPHRLVNGDKIKLGDTTLHFWVG